MEMQPEYELTDKGKIRLYVQSIDLSLEEAISFFGAQGWVEKVGPTRGIVHTTLGKSITITPDGGLSHKKIKANFIDSLDSLSAPSAWDTSELASNSEASRDPIEAAMSKIEEILKMAAVQAYKVFTDLYGQMLK